MRLILEYKGDSSGGLAGFAEGAVVQFGQFQVAEMVPGRGVVGTSTCSNASILCIVGWLDDLPAIHTSLAFEGIMRIAIGRFVKDKQLTERFERKVSFYVGFFVDNARAQGLFMRLAYIDEIISLRRANLRWKIFSSIDPVAIKR